MNLSARLSPAIQSNRIRTSGSPTAAALLVVVCMFVGATNALAWRGGPFSNNSPLTSGNNGTYKASITGTNTIGVTTFASDSDGQSNGRFAIFHEGIGYFGTADAMLDHERSTVTGVFGSDRAVPTSSIVTLPGGTTTTVFNTLSGGFTAKSHQSGASFVFDGDGMIQGTANGLVPFVSDVETDPVTGDETVVTEFLHPIGRFTKIRVKGLRTAVTVPATTLTRP